MSFLKNLHVVLVRAENPMNIGACARAMKNFGCSHLDLVRCAPHRVDAAYTPGWKAREFLEKAIVHDSLDKISKKTNFCVGFTTRSGKRRGVPRASFVDATDQIADVAKKRKVFLIFGNEKNGLSNDELNQCHMIATIPTHSAYRALNLSHAVAVVLFALYSKLPEAREVARKPEKHYAKPEEFEALMEQFLKTLQLLGYRDTESVKMLSQVHEHIRHFFQKTGVERRELHLFHAFLERIKTKCGN